MIQTLLLEMLLGNLTVASTESHSACMAFGFPWAGKKEMK